MKISACWITRNEAVNITRSIESLKEAVDELIVVDTGSTDDTVKIAQSLGARTDYFEWISDFSAAKNYALSLATGELIIFLDADEWFEPKLDRKQRELLERIFNENPILDGLNVSISNINMDTGLLIDKMVVIRVFRNGRDIRYQNRIHEALKKSEIHMLNITLMEGWNLKHSGYTNSLMPEKMKRNIAMLKHEEEIDSDDSDTSASDFYLMREYHNANQHDEAFRYLSKLRCNEAAIKQLCVNYKAVTANYFYLGMRIASMFRTKVSRRDVYDTLVVTMKKLLPDYPGSETIQLLYQAHFDLKEDRFMKELEPSIKAAGKKKKDLNTFYKDAHAALFACATKAAWRRGEKERAFEYAYACFTQNEGFFNYTAMGILLNCLKGQPETDIILFLNRIIDVSNEEKRSWMMKSLQMEGYATVYTYYLKKQLEQGTVSTDGYLLLMMLLGRYDEAVQSGLSQYKEIPEVIRDNIFLAAVCSGKESIYRDNLQYLEGYEHILEAFFNGRRLSDITSHEQRVLLHHYQPVAFVAGMAHADKLLDVFMADQRLCFLAKARYCVHNGLFEEVLKEDIFFLERDDFKSRELLINCYSSTGLYGKALKILEQFLEDDFLTPDIFHWLLVVSEKAEQGIREKARRLYDDYVVVYDEIIDLRDVINTKIVYDDSSKKQRRALRYTTMEQFEKLAKKDTPPIPHKELLQVLLEAATVYEEKELYTMAQQCYRRLYAGGYKPEETLEGLARVFEKLDNRDLAAEFRSRVVMCTKNV